MRLTRRDFVKAGLGLSGAALAGSRFGRLPARAAEPLAGAMRLPANPADSGIDHVVVVMMENRSFDHFMGWLPGANGRQAGLTYLDPSGQPHETYHITQPSGCGFNDPDHSYEGGRIQYDGGKMDGFLTDKNNDRYAIGYYTYDPAKNINDRPFMYDLALNYTTCDNYFCSILAETYPNRFFMHSAQTDRLHNSTTQSTMPTIWDRLNQPGGPTGRYYFSDLPFTLLWGQTYLDISSPFERFLADAAAGTLPNVAFVDPRFEDEGSATSGDDHPRADIRAGDAFLSQVFQAVSSGPGWDRTVLVVNYDEWGGFFDHVAPSRVTPGVPVGASPTSGIDKDVVDGKVLLGFRVPCIVASPFTRGAPRSPRIARTLYDHTSVLKMIEWRWGLKPLTQRDASTLSTDPQNLALALDFAKPDPAVPSLPRPQAPPPLPCQAMTASMAASSWRELADSNLGDGWRL